MRGLGLLLIAGGCIGGCVSCAMDTTVPTSGGDRVYNIGLVSERQNTMLASGAALIVGVLLFGFGELIAQRTPKGPWCPTCNGPIEGTPKICRHCSAELGWIDEKPVTIEAFEAHRTRRVEAAERRAEVLEEGVGRLVEAVKLTCYAPVALLRSLFSLAASAGAAFDAGLKKAGGDGNDIIYRFFQTLLYLGVPAGILLAVIFMR
jgi:hypothetical protein